MHRLTASAYTLACLAVCVFHTQAHAQTPVGATGLIGCREDPQQVDRLVITEPGVYENYLVDSRWQGGNRVKITADGVTLRNCEIRNAAGNGIGVFGADVLIENCSIHHLLNGSFSQQSDAHGITGRPKRLVVRNCEIYYVSGDALQFDPGRTAWDDVLIENCTLWTGPLPEDAGEFKAGQRPGENAFDSKTPPGSARCRVTIRNCLLYGWNQPGQITTFAALNLKEQVDATVERCLFRDNEVCFRVRGPGARGGAKVTIRDCAVYDSQVGVRIEDRIENLVIERLGFGAGVKQKYQNAAGGPGPGYSNTGEYDAPPYEELRTRGFSNSPSR